MNAHRDQHVKAQLQHLGTSSCGKAAVPGCAGQVLQRADRLEVELHSREKARVSALHLRAGCLGLGLTLQAFDSCAAWMPCKQHHKGLQQRPFLI